MAEKTRSVIRTSYPVFHVTDLPERGAQFGMTLYRGKLVCWDEDYDTRVLDLVDNMLADLHPYEKDLLIAVGESEAGISFVWSGHAPTRYADGQELEVADDVWSVADSVII